MTCPVCTGTKIKDARPDLRPHPYVACTYCGTFYQPEPPPKTYEGAHEISGDKMSDQDKRVNEGLARWLVQTCLAGLRAPKCLDIGAKYPYLMKCVKDIVPTSEVLAFDGIAEIPHFGDLLNVPVQQLDVEKDEWCDKTKYDLITLVHVLEHFYEPYDTLEEIQWHMAKGGHLFIRCPLNDVAGIERDFTKGHYTIHPTIMNTASLHVLAERLRLQIVFEQPMNGYGQGDFVLMV